MSLEQSASSFNIGWIAWAQQTINPRECFFLIITRIFVQRIGNNPAIVFGIDIHCGNFADLIFLKRNDMLFRQRGICFDNHFSCLFIYHIFSNNAIDEFFSNSDCGITVKNAQNFLGLVKPQSSQQSRNRQFAFAVDMNVHNIVDIETKFEPGSVVGNNSGGK